MLVLEPYTFIHRFTFQGQESDDEIKGSGNSVNYKYRMHDPRVGRFFAVDPLKYKFPYYSPYQFGANCVIMAIELEGLETSVQINHTEGSIIITRNTNGQFQVTHAQLLSIGTSGPNHENNWNTNTKPYSSRSLEKGGFMDAFCGDCINFLGGKGDYVTIKIANANVIQKRQCLNPGKAAVTQDKEVPIYDNKPRELSAIGEGQQNNAVGSLVSVASDLSFFFRNTMSNSILNIDAKSSINVSNLIITDYLIQYTSDISLSQLRALANEHLPGVNVTFQQVSGTAFLKGIATKGIEQVKTGTKTVTVIIEEAVEPFYEDCEIEMEPYEVENN